MNRTSPGTGNSRSKSVSPPRLRVPISEPESGGSGRFSATSKGNVTIRSAPELNTKPTSETAAELEEMCKKSDIRVISDVQGNRTKAATVGSRMVMGKKGVLSFGLVAYDPNAKPNRKWRNMWTEFDHLNEDSFCFPDVTKLPESGTLFLKETSRCRRIRGIRRSSRGTTTGATSASCTFGCW
ncbi:hypothetical protein SARC_06921 [Sphaeroforma arctica JP610]|uniref:Uncharacterized protein n=1 Tax=Sphaeroforma arctica JP610 TaxID=667725 RepID=A0A0L0FVQ4_9EUKA|nr:hypothetical protein SARC_06921 [Sphaeroforma arctica JP610]KNC80719.1 hypothetical protein SARC_06921 [Sphaeroforma arctica JP610]|eukprot:XP_014154621.1 hypothetical protein SARC_06921 [Sphaeroforma arctica JP610]